jgi:hypothetical protein
MVVEHVIDDSQDDGNSTHIPTAVPVLTEREADAVAALCRLSPCSVKKMPIIPSTSVSVLSEQVPDDEYNRRRRRKKQRREGPVPEHLDRTEALTIARGFKDTRVVPVNTCLLIAIMDVYGPRLMEHAAQETDFLFKHDRKKELVEAICKRSLEMAVPDKQHMVVKEIAAIRNYFENR